MIITKRQLWVGLLFAMIAMPVAHANPLRGTLWDRIADETGVESTLLYAYSLKEARKLWPDRLVRPWPWTLYYEQKDHRFETRAEAEKALREVLQRTDNVDVGLMQLSVRWHGHRVDDPVRLLDPETNIRLAARFVAENIQRPGESLAMRVGRYHNRHPERALPYADDVLRIREALVEHWLRRGEE